MGDKVLFKLTPQIWKKLKNKAIYKSLVCKCKGPFEVLKKVGNLAYRLKLSDAYKIHLIFHVSFLKSFYKDMKNVDKKRAQRGLTLVQVQFDRMVKKILNHRTMGQSKRNWRINFLI